MMVKEFEEMKPPPHYKPRYQMSEKSMDSVLHAIPFSLDRARVVDSLLSAYEQGASFQDSIAQRSQSGIDASLIGINDAGYPDSIHVKLSIKDEKGFFVKGLAGPNRKKMSQWQRFNLAILDGLLRCKFPTVSHSHIHDS